MHWATLENVTWSIYSMTWCIYLIIHHFSLNITPILPSWPPTIMLLAESVVMSSIMHIMADRWPCIVQVIKTASATIGHYWQCASF